MISTDDKMYNILMAKYKEMRSTAGLDALPYLESAIKLREKGNVSDDAIIGAAYL